MTRDDIFRLLTTDEYGAYVMSPDQTILFWNQGAERILGYPANQVVGRRCYEVVTGLATGGFSPVCQNGCPSIRAVRSGLIPPALNMRMLCGSGERKTVFFTPMVVRAPDAPLLVYLFHDRPEPDPKDLIPQGFEGELINQGSGVGPERSAIPSDPTGASQLTPREVEVLRLVSQGWVIQGIAEELAISPHTVRNHIRNLRQRLNAKTKLDAVMIAMRMGIL